MLAVAQVEARRSGDRWLITWRFDADEPEQISSVWLPHSRFRAEAVAFAPAIQVPPAALVTTDVWCDGIPGESIVNAFVIARTANGPRYFRLRVDLAEGGEPRAVVERSTG